MSSNCHNSGKIPWTLLADSIICKDIERKNWEIDEKKLTHFSNVFRTVIEDFSKTYKKEATYELNPNEWPWSGCSSCGAQVSYFDSLFSVYVRLNLILLSSKLNINSPLTNYIWTYQVCLGDGDYTPDDYIISKFETLKEKLFEEIKINSYQKIYKINTLTKELINETRDYLKELFVCLIRMKQGKLAGCFKGTHIEATLVWDLGLTVLEQE